MESSSDDSSEDDLSGGVSPDFVGKCALSDTHSQGNTACEQDALCYLDFTMAELAAYVEPSQISRNRAASDCMWWVMFLLLLFSAPLWGGLRFSLSSMKQEKTCSAEEEQVLVGKLGAFDVVIPWVNGSDPAWLERRAKLCVEWQWKEMWPDAVLRSADVRECLASRKAVQEAADFFERGLCADGAFGYEGNCGSEKSDKAYSTNSVARGLTVQTSMCFQQFAAKCSNRLKTIRDHGELRYLLRSLHMNLNWHHGRIFLITPGAQTPVWLQLHEERLKIVPQEQLFRAALSSGFYVPKHARNGYEGYVGPVGYAPDHIFNDFPVEASLAFLPNLSRVVMLIQDDVLFARPISICKFFTVSPPALRVFARRLSQVAPSDPYKEVYASLEWKTSQLWSSLDEPKTTSPFFKDLHLPQMLDRDILIELWKRYPSDMSATLDSAFRHANITHTVGLHHSEVFRRAQSDAKEMSNPNSSVCVIAKGVVESQPSTCDSNEDAMAEIMVSSSEVDTMESSGRDSVRDLPWAEINLESLNSWRDTMASVMPEPSELPSFLSIQDMLDDEEDSLVAELDCARERWLSKLLFQPSPFENPESPPNFCNVWDSLENRAKDLHNSNQR